MDDTVAFEAMLAHHRGLEEAVAARAAAVVETAASNGPCKPAAGELVAYLAEEVLPHASAEERTIYEVAAAHAELAALVKEMLAEHSALLGATEQLASATDCPGAAEQAKQIAAFFSAHVAKENEALLPALLAGDQVDLSVLVSELHQLTERARHPETAIFPSDADPAGTLVTLLLEAATALVAAGQGDQACQLAASAWAALREARPDLASRLTAGLHRLVRGATTQPVQLGAVGARSGDPGLDVRPLTPARRHQLIFDTYEALAPGKGFVLINDHDPKPLRYQFEAEHPGQFTWDYLEAPPSGGCALAERRRPWPRADRPRRRCRPAAEAPRRFRGLVHCAAVGRHLACRARQPFVPTLTGLAGPACRAAKPNGPRSRPSWRQRQIRPPRGARHQGQWPAALSRPGRRRAQPGHQ